MQVNNRVKRTREQLLEHAQQQMNFLLHHRTKHMDTWTMNEKFEAGDVGVTNQLIEEFWERTEPLSSGWYRISTRNGLLYKGDHLHIFRVYHYPEEELHSLQETLDFMALMQRTNRAMAEDENTMPRLEEFWTKYPEAMITFG